jgi:hypothetical protein
MSNKQVLVYFRGVRKLTRGYSDPWWAALSPYAARLQDGDPGETTSKRYEVFWSEDPDPACAHGSYFDAQNLTTNRDIYGRFIAT